MAEGEEASWVRGSEIRETRRTRRRAVGEAEAGGAACAVLSSRAAADEETNASCHPRDAGKSSSRSRFPLSSGSACKKLRQRPFSCSASISVTTSSSHFSPSHFLNPRPPGCPSLSLSHTSPSPPHLSRWACHLFSHAFAFCFLSLAFPPTAAMSPRPCLQPLAFSSIRLPFLLPPITLSPATLLRLGEGPSEAF